MRWWQLVRVPDRAPQWSLVVPEPPDVAFARVRRAAFHTTLMHEWRPLTMVSALPSEAGEPCVRAHYLSSQLSGSRAGATVMTVRFTREPDGGCRARATFRQSRWSDLAVSVLAWVVLVAVVGGLAGSLLILAIGRAVPLWLAVVPWVAFAGGGLSAVQIVMRPALAESRIAEDVAALRYWLARSLRAPEAEQLLSRAPGR